MQATATSIGTPSSNNGWTHDRWKLTGSTCKIVMSFSKASDDQDDSSLLDSSSLQEISSRNSRRKFSIRRSFERYSILYFFIVLPSNLVFRSRLHEYSQSTYAFPDLGKMLSTGCSDVVARKQGILVIAELTASRRFPCHFCQLVRLFSPF